MADDPWGSFNTISTPGGGGGYVDSGRWATPSSGVDWNRLSKALNDGSPASEDQPIKIPPLQVQQPNIPQSQAVGSHLGFSMRDVIELLYKRQQQYQQAGMNPKGGVVPPDTSAPMGLLGIR